MFKSTLQIIVLAFLMTMARAAAAPSPPTDKQIDALIEECFKGNPVEKMEATETLGRNTRRAVAGYIRALKSEDKWLRQFAAMQLAAFGSEAAPAMPALRAALRDNYEYAAAAAARALGSIGSEAAAAIPELIEVLKRKPTPDVDYVKVNAALALASIAKDDDRPVEALMTMLTETRAAPIKFSERSARQSMGMLGHTGRTPQIYLDYIGTLSANERAGSWDGPNEKLRTFAFYRVAAALSLGALQANRQEVIAALGEMTREKDVRHRIAAAKAAGLMGEAGSVLSDELIAMARRDEAESVRQAAIHSMALIHSEKATAALAELIRKEGKEAEWALQYLARPSSSDPKPALPELIELARKPGRLSDYALSLLGRIGSDARDAIPILLKRARDPQDPDRTRAIYALGQIDSGNEEFVAQLKAWAGSATESPPVKLYAKRALDEIETRVRFRRQMEMLKSGNDELRRKALKGYRGMVHTLSKEVIPLWVEIVTNPKEPIDLRRDAAMLIGSAVTIGIQGHESDGLAEKLLPLLSDADPTLRANIIWTIGDLGPKAEAVIPKFIDLLHTPNEDPQVRRAILHALGGTGSRSPVAVKALLAATKDKKADIRKSAVKGLGRMDPKAGLAVPALISLLTRPSADVRREAAKALVGFLHPPAEEAVGALQRQLKKETDRAAKQAMESALSTITSRIKEN